MKSESALRPFIAIIGRHWPAMLLGTLLSLLAALAAIGLLSLSGWFLAASAYAGLNATTALAFNFFFPSIGVRLFAITRTLARYSERIVCHEATFRILETLRGWCYRRIEPLVPARLSRFHSGDLLSRIITDIDTLDNLYLRVLSPTIVVGVTVAMLVGFVAYYNLLIAMTTAVVLLLAGLALPLTADVMARPAARQLNRQFASLRSHVADGLHGLAALLSCGAQADYLQRLDQRHQALIRHQRQMSRVTGITAGMMHLLSGIAVLATLYIGVPAVVQGSLSGPILALLCLAVMAGFEIVAVLPNAYQFLGQTRKAAVRLLEVTRTAPAVVFPIHADPEPSDYPLEFRGVSFRYRAAGQDAVHNLDFQIPHGRRTAIMGTTGAGKSTLIYLLARFEDPRRGEIRLAGRPLTEYSEEFLRRLVCIIDQRAHLFNGTLRDNLLITAPGATDAEIQQALVMVQLDEFTAQLPAGLDTWVGEAGRLLSGGQSRRLAVARAVLSAAPIWVFDEPTEGLDAGTADAMLSMLLEQGRGRTIIMITHRSEAIDQMDEVLILEQGRMTARGSPARLKAGNAVFRKLMGEA